MSEEDKRHGEGKATKKEPDEIVFAFKVLLKLEMLVDLTIVLVRDTLGVSEVDRRTSEHTHQREGKQEESEKKAQRENTRDQDGHSEWFES